MCIILFNYVTFYSYDICPYFMDEETGLQPLLLTIKQTEVQRK